MMARIRLASAAITHGRQWHRWTWYVTPVLLTEAAACGAIAMAAEASVPVAVVTAWVAWGLAVSLPLVVLGGHLVLAWRWQRLSALERVRSRVQWRTAR